MQNPIKQPRMTVSRRRLDLIIETKESIPGSVSAHQKSIKGQSKD